MLTDSLKLVNAVNQEGCPLKLRAVNGIKLSAIQKLAFLNGRHSSECLKME